MQLKLNGALHQAVDTLKKDERCANKSIEISWKADGTKDRGVKVDGRMAFHQTSNDIVGRFLQPFQDIVV